MSTPPKENKSSPGFFNERPTPFEKHPKNALVFISEQMELLRKQLPQEKRSRTSFGEIAGRYFGGKAISRERIRRFERGDPGVSWGLFIVYLCETNLLKPILKNVLAGPEDDLRYLSLLRDEVKDELQLSIDEELKLLDNDEY